jgi:DNA-binding beta-propeller fold protein YncE
MRVRAALVAFGMVLVSGGTAYAADGASPAPAVGGAGVALGTLRYVALPAARGTTIAEIDRQTGTVERFTQLRGDWGIPLVTWNNDAGGISADGGRLVLQERPKGAVPTRSRFAVIDPGTMRVLGRLAFSGSYSFDAISPDGHWLYLIEHVSIRNLTRYSVRVYDLLNHRLVPGSIVDKTEPDERMAGMPIQRLSTADGRWAYTLYQKPRGTYFVHALDTATRTARCIDLPGNSSSTGQLSLSPDGSRLRWRHAPRTTVIDTRTFKVVSAALPQAAPAAPRHHDGTGGTDRGRLAVGAVLGLLFAASGAALAVRRRRPAREGSGGAAAGAPSGP